MNILVVDDQRYVVEGICAAMDWKPLGIDQVFQAFSGSRAMELVKDNTVDILITDIEMPYISGIDLAEWVHHRNPDIAIIFLTAHADFAYAQKAVQIGCYDYIVQPVDYKKLEESIGRAVGRLQKTKNMTDMYGRGVKWGQMKQKLHEHFWHEMIFGYNAPSLVDVADEAGKIELELDWEDSYELLIIASVHQVQSLRHWREQTPNYALIDLIREMVEARCEVIYREPLDAVTIVMLMKSCRPCALLEELIGRAQQELKCTLACYLSEPEGVLGLSARYRQLEAMRSLDMGRTAGVIVQNAMENETNADDIICRIKDYIAANIDHELNRDEIAEQVFVSKDYISRLFKKKEGMALVDYINNQKILRAKALLLETDIPVSLVAIKVGIPNYSYFCKLFKKLVGMSASEYRGKTTG